jgi:uncharacterized glyoxalase superfamily protein PhnB
VPDVAAAVDWLCRAFGFSERLRIADHRTQLTFGDGAIVVAQRPAVAEGASVLVRVPNVEHHARSREMAEIVVPPSDYPYGERQYTALDPFGTSWTFSQTIADVDPADWGGVLVER